jgi:hypothetical protein
VEKTLTAHEHPLIKVFSSDFQFTIPDYQRPYRWGTDQVLQLLDDLEESLERDPADPYFLGSLVLIAKGGSEYDVVDGQQRLTTLTVLFAVLRDLSDGDVASDLRDLVLEPGKAIAGLSARPRLSLREQDESFFAKYVQEPGHVEDLLSLSDNAAASESQRAIRDNARALHARLAQWTDAKRLELAQLASTRTFLVVVSTPDLSSAYRIFSVMNARGLDLSPTDIFKSRVTNGLPRTYGKKWEDAEDALGRDGFADLFLDIRSIISGVRPRKELLKEFPEQVLNAYLTTGRSADFVDDVLLPYSRAFERTTSFDFGPGFEWRPVNDWLKRLDMIDNKDWRPAALWAITNHADEPVFLSAFLCKLERLAASFLLRREYTTPRVTRYFELLGQLKSGAGLGASAFELSPAEKADARAAVNGDVYRMQTKRARYVLLRLDELLANDPGATYAHSIITIEHVLPQTPNADSQWVQDFSEEERVEWTHKLGNLLLLNQRKNSQARNYDFNKKKSRYFTTSTGSAVFALTTQVLGYDQWTPAVVAARQQQLSQVLIDEWDLG